MQKKYEFEIDECVYKIGGSYQAEGTIKARFLADDGTPRYVFRFDNPPGLLHIFNEKQLDHVDVDELLAEQPKDYSDEDATDNKPLLEQIRHWFGL
jgi:hypothetical protein